MDFFFHRSYIAVVNENYTCFLSNALRGSSWYSACMCDTYTPSYHEKALEERERERDSEKTERERERQSRREKERAKEKHRVSTSEVGNAREGGMKTKLSLSFQRPLTPSPKGRIKRLVKSGIVCWCVCMQARMRDGQYVPMSGPLCTVCLTTYNCTAAKNMLRVAVAVMQASFFKKLSPGTPQAAGGLCSQKVSSSYFPSKCGAHWTGWMLQRHRVAVKRECHANVLLPKSQGK